MDAPLHLSFDPSVLAFVDGAPGEFLTQRGSSVVFLADASSRSGDVALALGRVEREQGASGAGLLCRVHFRGIGSGGTNISVAEARAWSASGDEVPVLASGAIVAVH